MKRKIIFIMTLLVIFSLGINTFVMAEDISPYNNNTAMMHSAFVITETGEAIVGVNYEGYTDVTTGATITIKIEKRNLLFFWSDVVDETITAVGDSYFNEFHYQLEDKGTYRCTVVYTVSGTGGPDDVLTFEDTEKYE
jgi:hypothetical protein